MIQLTPDLIEDYKADRIKFVCVATVNRELSLAKSILNKTMEWGFVDRNPFQKVKFFKENNTRTRFLGMEEFVRLIAACSERLKPIVIVAVGTGLRKSNILKLQWDQIHYQINQICVRRPKGRSDYYIPMDQIVADLLKVLHHCPSCSYVFCQGSHKPPSVSGWVRKDFTKALLLAGIVDFMFHDLRHTFASYLAMAGYDVKTIMELLGHSSTRMAERYIHLSPQHKQNAVNRSIGPVLDKVLKSQTILNQESAS